MTKLGERVVERVDTVIVGAGPAGINMSTVLTMQKRSHVVLERSVTFDSWKNKRWDSFKLNSAMKCSKLVNQRDDYQFSLPDDKPGVPLEELLGVWTDHINRFDLPIVENSPVTAIFEDPTSDDDSVVVETPNKTYIAKNVVLAAGVFSTPKIPACAQNIDAKVKQLDATTFKNVSDLNPGGVLIVGSAQTGSQLAHHLAVEKNIENVHLATSKTAACPRGYRGKDFINWMVEMDAMHTPRDELPDPETAYNSQSPTTGSDHALSLHSLSREGVVIHGGLKSLDKGTAYFENNLKENLASVTSSYNKCVQLLDSFVTGKEQYKALPPYELEEAWRPDPNLISRSTSADLELDMSSIGTIIWATGWNFDLSFVQIESVQQDLGREGLPIKATTPHPGVFWLGYNWIRQRSSSLLLGMPQDAKFLETLLR